MMLGWGQTDRQTGWGSVTTHSAKIIPKRRKATGATYAEQHPTSSMLAVAGSHEPSLTAYRWLWLHQALGRSGRALSRPRRATGPPSPRLELVLPDDALLLGDAPH